MSDEPHYLRDTPDYGDVPMTPPNTTSQRAIEPWMRKCALYILKNLSGYDSFTLADAERLASDIARHAPARGEPDDNEWKDRAYCETLIKERDAARARIAELERKNDENRKRIATAGEVACWLNNNKDKVAMSCGLQSGPFIHFCHCIHMVQDDAVLIKFLPDDMQRIMDRYPKHAPIPPATPE